MACKRSAHSATSDEVKALCRENRDLKDALTDRTLENRQLKKHDRGWGDEEFDIQPPKSLISSGWSSSRTYRSDKPSTDSA